MLLYILKRLVLVIPTLFGVMLVNFLIIKFVPGGPIEQIMLKHQQTMKSEYSGASANKNSQTNSELRVEIENQLKQYYNLDLPLHKQFIELIKNYLTFNFGNSFYQDKSVIQLILDALPTSISLGFWVVLISYLVSIPLGIYKATNNNSKFDFITSSFVTVGYAIPSFIFALILLQLFSSSKYFHFFPLSGLVSDNFESMTFWEKIKDYAWHMFLPIMSSVLGSFAALTLLTKNSFLEEIGKTYVLASTSMGLVKHKVLFGQVFRNAMLVIVSGMPATIIGIFLTSSLLIEIIFSLDGLGMLSYNAILQRDYPIIFASLYIFTLLSLVVKIISDLIMVAMDPRINFDKKSS